MKYTALVVVLLGVLIACFAGLLHASAGPPAQSQGPSVASLVVPLAFAAALVLVGVAMWVFGGKGYTVSGPRVGRRPAGEATERGTTRITRP